VTRARTVWLAPRLVAALEREARRRMTTVSACVEHAWHIAWPRIALLAPPAAFEQNFDEVPPIPGHTYEHPRAEAVFAEQFAGGEAIPVDVALKLPVYEDLVEESYRLARSLGWLIERAWCLTLVAEPALWLPVLETADTAPMPRYE
jgi:hypothetical protein